MNKDITWKRIFIFVGITFLITYLVGIFGVGSLMQDDSTAIYGASLVVLIMFIPTIGVLLTRLFTREGFKNLWLLSPSKKNIKYYLMAWFGPSILVILGAVLYFLIFPSKFDSSLSYLRGIYELQGITITQEQLMTSVLSQAFIGIFLGPIVNFINCLGEEFGWRGYLLPKMKEKFSFLPTVLITGLIWGLWHAPLTWVVGHNYGFGYWGYPFTGILAMCCFCIAIGTFLSYLTLKTKSCLAATFAHASLNAIASLGLLFANVNGGYNSFVGPAPTGIIGGLPFIIVAVIIIIYMMKQEKQA